MLSFGEVRRKKVRRLRKGETCRKKSAKYLDKKNVKAATYAQQKIDFRGRFVLTVTNLLNYISI